MTSESVSNPESELALLSCLIQGADLYAVRADFFTVAEYRDIYHALCLLTEQGKPLDVEAIALHGKVALHRVNQIEQAVPTTLHFRTYLKDCALACAQRKRRLTAAMLTDATRTMEDLRSAFREIVSLESYSGRSLDENLVRLRFDPTREPPKARPIFRLVGKVVATAGNLVVVAARAKAGKTAFLGAMLGATTGGAGDTLGVRSDNPNQHAVVLFDTEQSEADFYRGVRTAFRRVQMEPPSWLHAYSVVRLSVRERFEALRNAVTFAKRSCLGVHSVFIDGAADLITDPNDPEEAFALVSNLHAMAVQFDTAIVAVIHFNPSTTNAKTRGHLGSQLERKAEANIVLERDAHGVTTAYALVCRGAPVFKNEGPRFEWSNAFGMHKSLDKADRRSRAPAAAAPDDGQF